MSMYRHLLRHSLIYSIGIVAGKLAAILLLPIYTRYLTPSDYGVLELLDITFIVTTLIGMRFGESVFYFHAAATTPEAQRSVISTAMIGASAVGIVASLVCGSLSQQISQLVFGTPQYTSYFHIVFLTLACSFPIEVGLSYLRLLNMSIVYVALSVGRLAVLLVLNVCLIVWFRMGMTGMLSSTLLTAAVTAAVVLVYSLSQ